MIEYAQPDESAWLDFEAAIKDSTRVFVWGPPGVGKSSLGYKALRQEGKKVFQLTLQEDMVVQELTHTWIPAEPQWQLILGPVVYAFEGGHGLVVNELARASGPVKDMFLGMLDDPSVAELVLPDLRQVPYQEGFRVVATSNDPPTDLDEALIDRFDAVIHLRTPHPDIIESLNDACAGLGDVILHSYENEGKGPISPRRAFAFLNFLSKGRSKEQAARLALRDQGAEFLALLQAADIPVPARSGDAH